MIVWNKKKNPIRGDAGPVIIDYPELLPDID